MAATLEVSTILLQLLVLFAGAKLFGTLATFARIPSVVGEIVAGVVIGNTLLRESLQFDASSDLLHVIAELGVVFLIFTVGLETPFEEMKRVGLPSVLVAILGVVVPFLAGYLLFAWTGRPLIESLFLGAALVATSVGITARVLADLGVLGRREARIILGAAVIDDVLGLTILSVVQALGSTGTVSFGAVALLVVESLAFVGVLMYFGGRVLRRVVNPPASRGVRFGAWVASREVLFPFAILLCLALSALSTVLGLAAIIGAFLAGMAFAATDERHALVVKFEALVAFFVPFFFAFIGMQIDLTVAFAAIGLALLVTAIAIATKLVGCAAGAWPFTGSRSAVAIGVGMVPRGEVGIIVALVGLSLHAIPESLYSIVVTMSLLTTIVTPPALVWAFKRLPSEPRAQSGS